MLEDLRTIFLSLPALAFLGLVVGSFLNVVIHRLPTMVERATLADSVEALSDRNALSRAGFNEGHSSQALGHATEMREHLNALPELSLSEPRSSCPSCGHRIRWYENVPVLAWLVLRGRCSSCGVGISARYVVVELATAMTFAGLAWRMGPHVATLAWAGFSATIMAASVIDWETSLLPDVLTQPLLWAGLLAAAGGLTVAPVAAVFGAAAGYLLPWGLSMLLERLTGKAAMAPGDFKLLAAIGAWMGWQLVAPVLALALILGSGVLLLRVGRSGLSGSYFPFGPYLGTVAVAFALTGPSAIVNWL